MHSSNGNGTSYTVHNYRLFFLFSTETLVVGVLNSLRLSSINRYLTYCYFYFQRNNRHRQLPCLYGTVPLSFHITINTRNSPFYGLKFSPSMMQAESLTALIPQQEEFHSERESYHNATGINDNNNTNESWSIKRLLTRRVRRQYRVLEREPNRLRKRSIQSNM